MIFKIDRVNMHDIDGSHDVFNWSLEKGGKTIAIGLDVGSEEAVRSAIAEFKKAGGGLKFAKVEGPDPKEAR